MGCEIFRKKMVNNSLYELLIGNKKKAIQIIKYIFF